MPAHGIGGRAELQRVGDVPADAVDHALDAGHPQVLVPAGVWQSARLLGPEPALVTCVVSPGFDFADFELADPSP